MKAYPEKISLDDWDARYDDLQAAALSEPSYGGPLRRHLQDGDLRLAKLQFDNSPAALRLWNFLLTEEDRLHQARAKGNKIVGAMKDLGTIPVMAFSLPNLTAFYPDGAWWVPCVMEQSAGLLRQADALGLDDSFCPVRAMLPAFLTPEHFPNPDFVVCSVGATCDDFSAIAQRLEAAGFPIHWWEIPHRRPPDPQEDKARLPGELEAPRQQVEFVKAELDRVRRSLEELARRPLNAATLSQGIHHANQVRRTLAEIRRLVFTADPCPLPALETLLAEMLAIHFCSDREECLLVLEDLLGEVRRRVKTRIGVLPTDAARIYWVNPVADLRAMNLLEECGGRLCGTEFLFSHALDTIPQDLEPLEALARTALADPMAGPAVDRARRVARDARALGAEAVAVSRIPGASHCPWEGKIIHETVQRELDIPVLEIEVPPVSDAMLPTLRNRIEALVETIKNRRNT